jgi:thymidine kinase
MKTTKMAKLFFRYSTMNAGKSIDILRIKHNYNEYGDNVICLTSAKDDRYGIGKITSRIGIQTDAISIEESMNIFNLIYTMKEKISCILVDESQFLTKEHIFQLSDIVDELNIPVICYGLRSDFSLEPFEGSKYLMAIADNVEEIKTICSKCKSKKAITNARMIDNKIVTKGEQVQIGGNESYKPLCRKCYKKTIKNE